MSFRVYPEIFHRKNGDVFKILRFEGLNSHGLLIQLIKTRLYSEENMIEIYIHSLMIII